MTILFDDAAWDDYLHWHSVDKTMVARLDGLLRECTRMSFVGIGKPEPSRGRYSGWRSRRMDQEHRLIYRVEDDTLLLAQCRHHYWTVDDRCSREVARL